MTLRFCTVLLYTVTINFAEPLNCNDLSKQGVGL